MELKQSGLGIASFILSVINVIFLFILVIILTHLDLTYPGGINALPDDAPQVVLPVLIALFMLISALVSVGLSIGGLCQKNRRNAFSIAGLVIQLVFLLLIFTLAIL